MSKIFRLLVFGGLFLSACEEDPLVQMDGFRTKPVVYSIIETFDSVHYIKIGRLFSGYTDPDITSQIHDSIYFDTVNIKVNVVTSRGIRTPVPVKRVVEPGKVTGFFNCDNYYVYRFNKVVVLGEFPNYWLPYEYVEYEVNIPGLPVAKCSTAIVFPPRIWSPMNSQQYVYLWPDNPIRVLWSGGEWNEIDVTFKVFEEYADTTVMQIFSVQKSNDVQINGKYYEIKITYELVQQILEKNLKVRHDIVRRYFGPFSIAVLTGNGDFNTYYKFQNGINDFSYNPFSNVENGLGMLSAKSSTTKDQLYLDQASRLKLAAEPSLKKFMFIEY